MLIEVIYIFPWGELLVFETLGLDFVDILILFKSKEANTKENIKQLKQEPK